MHRLCGSAWFALLISFLVAGCDRPGGNGFIADEKPGAEAEADASMGGEEITHPGRPRRIPVVISDFSDATITILFDEVAAENDLRSPGYLVQGNTDTFANLNNPDVESGYGSINLHYAHSSGLRGTGKTLALISDGFRTTQDGIQRKSIKFYNDQSGVVGVTELPRANGTALATMMAGTPESPFLGGPGNLSTVASGADLHLTATSAAGFDNSDLAAAIADADSAGAVVQAFAIELINTQTGAPVTLQEVEEFDTGDPDAESATIIPSLPTIYPSLEDNFIAVASAEVRHEGGEIVEFELHSSRCLETAAYCVLADGHGVTSASQGRDDFPELLQYSSAAFAMAQVAGSIALLSEAFPELPPKDILARLLASADNSFFLNDCEFPCKFDPLGWVIFK